MEKIQLIHKDYDKVVKSVYLLGMTSYKFANEKLKPQTDRYRGQRKKLKSSIYEKLERDIQNECIMPPITVAYVLNNVEEINDKTLQQIEDIVNSEIENSYILDGIQRLNTLNRAISPEIENRTLYINILISSKNDYLLYRMITLNNGQKPMSARHQIEVLASNIYDFDDLPLETQTEKQSGKKRIKGAFNKDLIIKGYIAFLSKSINIDNKKIIESKMDELIADNIIKSDLTKFEFEFINVVELIEKFVESSYLQKWFKIENNLIGFTAGISTSYNDLINTPKEELENSIQTFEEAFESFDVSRIKVGFVRRFATKLFIEKYPNLKDKSPSDLFDFLSQAAAMYI